MSLSDLGTGIGGIIGGGLASNTLGSGINDIGSMIQQGVQELAPYNNNGQQYLQPTQSMLLGQGTSGQVGADRVNMTTNPVDFENFAKNYNMSSGAQYLLNTQSQSLDNSAASRGGLLSSADLRGQQTLASGIANQDLLSQYQAMLSGQQQDFSQRETSYQNLFGQESLGESAAGTQAQTLASGAQALGQMYAAQAKAQSGKGGGMGSALSGIGGLVGMFM